MPPTCPAFLAALDPALCRSIDHYCERTSDAWHAEPLNAFSNLAFLLAGWAAWRSARRIAARPPDRMLAALIATVPLIGMGSFTFHTLATRWAEWVDIVPILLFMLLHLWLVMTRIFAWPVRVKLPALLEYAAATLVLEVDVPATTLWGGAMYLPTVAAFVALASAPGRWIGQSRGAFPLAIPLFLVAYALRTLDVPQCPTLPFGTHFLWHLIIALTVYLLVRAAIRHGLTKSAAINAIGATQR